MLKLDEDLLGQTIRANGTAFNQRDELGRLVHDIADLKRRICAQVTLIQELSWEAQETASAKASLRDMQETLRDWCAHRDLLVKLLAAEPQSV